MQIPLANHDDTGVIRAQFRGHVKLVSGAVCVAIDFLWVIPVKLKIQREVIMDMNT